MSDDRLIDAIETAKTMPERLTAADVALITKGAPDLAQWARDKRAQARERDDEIAITALGLDWQQYKGLSKSAQQGAVIAAAIKHATGVLAKRIDALEARTLELEADRAARLEPVP